MAYLSMFLLILVQMRGCGSFMAFLPVFFLVDPYSLLQEIGQGPILPFSPSSAALNIYCGSSAADTSSFLLVALYSELYLFFVPGRDNYLNTPYFISNLKLFYDIVLICYLKYYLKLISAVCNMLLSSAIQCSNITVFRLHNLTPVHNVYLLSASSFFHV
jgi:hypothetical protein